MKTNVLKRIGAVLLTLAVCFSLAVPMSVDAASTGKTYYLPTKLVNYKLVNGKWKKQSSYSYKYDSKGNIVVWAGTKLKPVYKKGKLVKVTVNGKNDDGERYKTVKRYNSKGDITYWECSYGNNDDDMVYLNEFTYNKKGYITKKTNMTEPDTYTYKYYSNGLPSEITHKYVHYSEDGRFNVKTTEKYDKDGFAKSGVTYNNKKKTKSWTQKVTTKNGKVTQIAGSGKENGESYKWKTVFSYGKAKTKNKKQYIAIMGMMNGTVIFQSIGNNSAVGWCY